MRDPRSLPLGLAAMFFEEVKRSAASHDEKKHRRSPPDLAWRAWGKISKVPSLKRGIIRAHV
jgi:hypothetical protein